MRQVAPDPAPLIGLLPQIVYKKGWSFTLDDMDRGQGSEGLTLVIRIDCTDSYHPERIRSVLHYMLVPPAAFDGRSWRRWLFEQILLVERHEAMEFFTVDGAKPFAPSHGPGNDPYMLREVGTVDDARTSSSGVLNP